MEQALHYIRVAGGVIAGGTLAASIVAGMAALLLLDFLPSWWVRFSRSIDVVSGVGFVFISIGFFVEMFQAHTIGSVFLADFMWASSLYTAFYCLFGEKATDDGA